VCIYDISQKYRLLEMRSVTICCQDFEGQEFQKNSAGQF